MNAVIWIRDPYPFRYDEYGALQQALCQSYGTITLVYLRDWNGDQAVDHVSIDGTNAATCKQIAATLKTIHVQRAILAKQANGRDYTFCQNLEIVIQKPDENRPTWAQHITA